MAALWRSSLRQHGKDQKLFLVEGCAQAQDADSFLTQGPTLTCNEPSGMTITLWHSPAQGHLAAWGQGP